MPLKLLSVLIYTHDPSLEDCALEDFLLKKPSISSLLEAGEVHLSEREEVLIDLVRKQNSAGLKLSLQSQTIPHKGEKFYLLSRLFYALFSNEVGKMRQIIYESRLIRYFSPVEFELDFQEMATLLSKTFYLRVLLNFRYDLVASNANGHCILQYLAIHFSPTKFLKLVQEPMPQWVW